MNVLLLMFLALSLCLNFALFSWALSERNHRQWQQAQLNQLRRQMLLANGRSDRGNGRWLTWLIILGLLFWIVVALW